MSSILRPRHLLIIAFCLWHMAAVTLYLLPSSDDPYPWTRAIRRARDLTSPYVLLTSQWQKWDIFSPNPQRRVSTYRIEQESEAGWETVAVLDYDHLPWWMRAKELKVLGRLERDWNHLAPSYLEGQCEDFPGADVRLIAISTTLSAELSQLRHMKDVSSSFEEKTLGFASCP